MDNNVKGVRIILLVLGVTLITAGVFCFVCFVLDAIRCADSFEGPSKPYLMIISLPMIGMGIPFLVGGLSKNIIRVGPSKNINEMNENFEDFFSSFDNINNDAHNVIYNICAKCGYENDKNANYCNKCGSFLFVTCPYCGELNDDGAEYCKKCGKKID